MTPRRCTVKARDFTDVLILDRDNFIQTAYQVSLDAIAIYNKMRDSCREGEKNYTELQVKCYMCDTIGHIALDC